MGNKTRRYYYIRVNEYYIVNLSKIENLGDMCDFLKLNIFTASFDTRDELISTLKRFNLIPNDINVESIDIVMRNGNKKQGYTYSLASNTLTMKRDLPFMHVPVIREFFRLNQFHFALIKEILQRRKFVLEEMLESYGKKAKPFIVKNLNERITNISRIIVVMGIIEYGNPSHIGEYISRLNKFIDSEVLYKKNGRETVNNRGLIELAKTISDYSNYKGVVLPKLDTTYVHEAIENRAIIDSDVLTFNTSKEMQPDTDPDSYMFLESKDFLNLLNSDSSKNMQESVEIQILDLEEKKSRKGMK